MEADFIQEVVVCQDRSDGDHMDTWNQRCVESVRCERKEVEKRYGIRIGRTEIYCKACGKSWSTFHECSGMSPERRAEVERLKAEFNRPWSLRTLSQWQEELRVNFGMSKEEALEKFLGWRETKKTCERCEGEKYVAYCPVNLICKEAEIYREEVVENGGENHSRSGTFENSGLEEIGIEQSSL